MRIMNIIFNAEIKYHQYAKLRKYLDTNIFGLTSTLEKPTRGKPVREGFVLFMSF
jgi:hypothetical protein